VWWGAIDGEIEGRRRRTYGAERAEGLVTLLYGREEYGGGGYRRRNGGNDARI
jgi:hypothetical protein